MKIVILKFTIRIALFIVVAVSLGLLASQNDNQDSVSPNLNVARVRASAGHGDLDILFLGSSYTVNAINTSLLDSLGYSAYNLGVSSSGPGFYEILLQDHIKSTRSTPKVVFLDVTLITFSSAGSDNWVAYAIHRYLNNPISNENVAWRYRAFDRYADMFATSFRKSVGNAIPGGKSSEGRSASKFDKMVAQMNESNGFEETPGTDSDGVWENEKQFFLPLNESEFSQKKAAQSKSLVTKLEGEGITAVLHELPTSEVEKYYSEEYKEKYRQQIAILAEEFHLVRAPDKVFDDKKYFRNVDHMNDVGAHAYTQHLYTRMKAMVDAGTITFN